MSAFIYFLIIMLTLLALIVVLVALGFVMVKSSRTLGLQPWATPQ